MVKEQKGRSMPRGLRVEPAAASPWGLPTHYQKTAVLSSGKTPLARLAVEPQASSCTLASLLLSEAAGFKHKTEEQDPARQTSRSKGPGARRGPGALSEALPQGGRRTSSHPG